MNHFWLQASPFLVAAGVSAIGTWGLILLAPRLGWVEIPRPDRWHRNTTAMMGGIALYGGVVSAAFIQGGMTQNAWLLGGLTLVFAGGVWDDRKGLSPQNKILVQAAGGLLCVIGGVVLSGPIFDQFGFGMVLTILWFVACANVVNLIDGMDGVAAGVVAASSTSAALIAFLAGSPELGGLALATAGACMGFLVFNRHPARIFMGDSGSLLLGFLMAALSVLAFNAVNTGLIVQVAVLPALLAVPLIDASFVALIRITVGGSFSDSGTHHIHHRLGLVGLSEHLVPIVLWGISFAFGLVAVVATISAPLFGVLFAVASLSVVLLEILLIDHTGLLPSKLGETAPAEGIKRVARILRMTHPWPKVVADGVMFAGALTLGTFLVTGTALLATSLWLAVLPVVVCKLVILRQFGIYRRGWFHGYGTPDLIRLVVAVLIGNVVTTAAEFSLFGLEFGGRIMMADLLVSILGAVALRAGYRAARHSLAGQKRSGRKALLYGAGEAGSLAAKEFRLNRNHGLWPVGFLDDNAQKKGGVFYGLRIHGSVDSLERLVDELGVELVVIVSSKIRPERRQEILGACQELGLGCVELRLDLHAVEVDAPDLRDQEVVTTSQSK